MAKGNPFPALTVGHELHNKPWVGDVRAAHLSATHALTHLRYHTRHFICKKEAIGWLEEAMIWKQITEVPCPGSPRDGRPGGKQD